MYYYYDAINIVNDSEGNRTDRTKKMFTQSHLYFSWERHIATERNPIELTISNNVKLSIEGF